MVQLVVTCAEQRPDVEVRRRPEPVSTARYASKLGRSWRGDGLISGRSRARAATTMYPPPRHPTHDRETQKKQPKYTGSDVPREERRGQRRGGGATGKLGPNWRLCSVPQRNGRRRGPRSPRAGQVGATARQPWAPKCLAPPNSLRCPSVFLPVFLSFSPFSSQAAMCLGISLTIPPPPPAAFQASPTPVAGEWAGAALRDEVRKDATWPEAFTVATLHCLTSHPRGRPTLLLSAPSSLPTNSNNSRRQTGVCSSRPRRDRRVASFIYQQRPPCCCRFRLLPSPIRSLPSSEPCLTSELAACLGHPRRQYRKGRWPPAPAPAPVCPRCLLLGRA